MSLQFNEEKQVDINLRVLFYVFLIKIGMGQRNEFIMKKKDI